MEPELSQLAREYIEHWHKLHSIGRRLKELTKGETISVRTEDGQAIEINPRVSPEFNDAPAFIRKTRIVEAE